jgi:threonine/homoserine/homoserine lactone efflux protein
MQLYLLFLLAAGIGFLAAIPVGGCQIEMAKRVLNGRWLAGQMVIAGSVSSDIVYGIVALFGIAPFMVIPWVLAVFNALGAILLWVLSYFTLRQSRRPVGDPVVTWRSTSKRWAFVTGFSLGISNPPMIMSWLLGVTLARHLGLADPLPHSAKAVFIAGGALGLGGYLSALGFVIHRVKHFVSFDAFGKVYRVLGITLFLLSFFFVYGVVKYFVR